MALFMYRGESKCLRNAYKQTVTGTSAPLMQFFRRLTVGLHTTLKGAICCKSIRTDYKKIDWSKMLRAVAVADGAVCEASRPSARTF